MTVVAAVRDCDDDDVVVVVRDCDGRRWWCVTVVAAVRDCDDDDGGGDGV